MKLDMFKRHIILMKNPIKSTIICTYTTSRRAYMKKLFSYRTSLSKKLVLTLTALVVALSFIFSITLYATTMYILEDSVKPQFDEKLQIVSKQIQREVDTDLALAAEKNDKAAAKAMHEKLLELQKEYNAVTVYIMNKTGGGNVVVMSDLPTTNLEYPYTEDMNIAADEQKKIISDIYTDENGTIKSVIMPIDNTDMLLGFDIDASFISKIQNFVIMICIILNITAIIFGIIVSYLVARSTVRPINKTLQYVNEVASGDLTTEKFELKNQDEVAKLADGVFQMVDDLRALIGQVSANSEQVASTSIQLSSNVQESQANISEIAHSVHNVATNSEGQADAINRITSQISTISDELAHITTFTKDVSNNADSTTANAQQGNTTVQNAVEQLSITTSTIDEASAIVHRLNNYTLEIGEIVRLISDITDQTNLLALNASIEAARAGEHGKGFAVVAEEVRKLADQSQQAASDIHQRISVIQSETSQAVDAMTVSTKQLNESTEKFSEAGASFNHIYQSVSTLSSKFSEAQSSIEDVTNNLNEMAATVHDVNRSIATTTEKTQTVSAASQQQSASIDEITDSASRLSMMTDQLKDSLVKFKV